MGCVPSSKVSDSVFETSVNEKLIGCRLEARDRMNPEMLCVATISI